MTEQQPQEVDSLAEDITPNSEKPIAKLPYEDEIKTSIFRLLTERGQGKTICPSEAARDIAGKDEKKWRLLMKPIKQVAVALALENEIQITRKRKPVDPLAFKGIYRLSLPE